MLFRSAFLGTGLMGAPMCQNLLSAGLPLTVWNRSLAKAEPLAKRGAVVADSPQSAVADADVVITMLSDGPVVSAVMFEQGAADAIRRSESTRLNSSHVVISYAVFCLKKKKSK